MSALRANPLRAALLTATVCLGPATTHAAVEPAVPAEHGMVATDHRIASQVGIEALRAGGNAVDAACAAAFALGVVQPAGSGIGGGAFMLIKPPGDAPPVVLDFRESAPAAATRDMYSKPGVAAAASRDGPLAVGVPGEVAGCAEALRRFGRRGLRRALAPAIKLARKGFPTGRHVALTLQRQAGPLRAYPDLRPLLFPNGKPLVVGQRFVRPRLARTLAAIARGGPKVFYQGWIARDIVDSVRSRGGVLTLEDLRDYKVRERAALATRYRGRRIYTMPPPSSGGMAMIETLNILRHFDLRQMGHNSSRYLHVLTEALKHAFADRARFGGDPDFVKVPIARITAQSYADRLLRRISKKVQALDSYGSGGPLPAPASHNGTSHLSIVDSDGMAVAMTTTINTSFGSKVVARRSGIILNNQMDDFAARPGKPNAYGLVQGESNAVAPHKRPLSSMSPTIVTDDKGRVTLVVGASGGPTIITGTLQVLLNVIDFKLEVRDAVSRARIHHQWKPNKIFIERDIPVDVRAALRRRGHRLELMKHPFTSVQAVTTTAKLRGASDPRKLGAAAGW